MSIPLTGRNNAETLLCKSIVENKNGATEVAAAVALRTHLTHGKNLRVYDSESLKIALEVSLGESCFEEKNNKLSISEKMFRLLRIARLTVLGQKRELHVHLLTYNKYTRN